MNILVTGASGFIGSALIETLRMNKNFKIKTLVREIRPTPDTSSTTESFYWNPEKNEIDPEAFADIDVVIHLAGENVANGRWTVKKKQSLINSRINGTRLLLREIKTLKKPPQKFISASAVGFYGNRADEILDEDSEKGNGFLADLCALWEAETLKNRISGMNSCVVRTGIVLGKNGGALKKMLIPFGLGVGGRIGSGRQFMSWVHIDDLVRIFIFLIEAENSEGIYNATSPSPVTNSTFSKILGEILHRPAVIPVPSTIIKALFGEMSEILLDGQRVLPKRLLKERFNFHFTALDAALKAICGKH